MAVGVELLAAVRHGQHRGVLLADAGKDGVHVELAQCLAKGLELGRPKLLPAQHHDEVVAQRGAQLLDGVHVQRPARVEAAYLGPERPGQPRDLQTRPSS